MIVPCESNVIILRDPYQPSGLIALPEHAQEPPRTGEVIAVGPGFLLPDGGRVTPEVAPGDRVFFKQHYGETFDAEGDVILIMPEEGILAKILPEPESIAC